jgi:hypothetical protein
MAALYLDKQIDLENLIDDYKKQLKNVWHKHKKKRRRYFRRISFFLFN